MAGAGGGGFDAGAAYADVKPSRAVAIAIACGGMAMPVTADTLRWRGSSGMAACAVSGSGGSGGAYSSGGSKLDIDSTVG